MKRHVDGRLITGLLLLGAGILALIGQFTSGGWSAFVGTFLLLGLGLTFLALGIYTREDGWFIPGGILTGLGSGVALLASPLINRLPGEEGGWFLILFALGWFLIPVMTAIFSDGTHWWAFIPGGVIGLVGAAITFGGMFMDTLTWAGKLWPLVLIALGLLSLWKARRPAAEKDETLQEKQA